MAGSNIMLKTGSVLFHEGDPSDGMYIIRKGEILIYLEKSATEVKLAKVSAGAMIGEMALFDKKPRSASAKATTETEVTKISNDDFAKILKQIPKWFVALMSTLSSRLRETNERLQAIENKASGHRKPLEDLLKTVGVLNLLFHKDATKERKSWVLDRDSAEDNVSQVLAQELEITRKITNALIGAKVLREGKTNYKKPALAAANKGTLQGFLEFARGFRESCPDRKSLSASCMGLVGVLEKMTGESAYAVATVPLDDAMREGQRLSLDTADWGEAAKELAPLGTGNGLQIVKVSGGIGFKLTKKTFPSTAGYLRILLELDKTGVL